MEKLVLQLFGILSARRLRIKIYFSALVSFIFLRFQKEFEWKTEDYSFHRSRIHVSTWT